MVADEHLNRARNCLKHWGAGDDDEIIVELETEAVLYITGGLINARRSELCCGAEDIFQAWVLKKRLDLLY